jgi:hypothetical protein
MIPGPNLQGYDIGCAFEATSRKAGIFQNCDIGNPCSHTLPALHGYGHNRLCQLRYQVNYCEGAGLSEFEQCERFFSSSNLVATLTRHSTSFHRHQFLEMHFEQANQDRLEALGKFIYEHYKRALGIIATESPRLEEVRLDKGFTAEVFLGWNAEEIVYLQSLKHEPVEDNLRCLYVTALESLWKAE